MAEVVFDIVASVPLLEPPGWALAERQLFDLLDHGWRRFARDFTGPDGRLNYRHALTTRDGVDDFYETFFNLARSSTCSAGRTTCSQRPSATGKG